MSPPDSINLTSRFFEEERELTVILLVDISGSGEFGTGEFLKREVVTEISAVLSFSAIQNNDKIGVIFFSDHIEKFIPPKKGKSHILHIIRELLSLKPSSKKTNIAEALRFLTNAIKKKSTAFLISDFIDSGYENALRIAGNKHDLVALKVFDPKENELPDVGLVPFEDSESGLVRWIDSSNPGVRKHFKKEALRREEILDNTLRKSGTDFASINIYRSYVKPLSGLFKRRGMRR